MANTPEPSHIDLTPLGEEIFKRGTISLMVKTLRGFADHLEARVSSEPELTASDVVTILRETADIMETDATAEE
jgi:hypothetical protein